MKHYHICISRLFFFLATIATFAACSSPAFDGNDIVSYEMPDTENIIFGADEANIMFRIVWSSEPKESNSLYRTVDSTSSVCLKIKKNNPAAILSYPECGGKPYGAIYPFTSTFCEKDGFAAMILYELYNSDLNETELQNIQVFNWLKLMELCRTFDTPWLLDADKIKTSVKSGKFKKTDVKLKK